MNKHTGRVMLHKNKDMILIIVNNCLTYCLTGIMHQLLAKIMFELYTLYCFVC